MAASAQQKGKVHWGGPPPRGKSFRAGLIWGATVTLGVIAAIGSFVPVFNILSSGASAGAFIGLDWMRNGIEKSDEHKYRAQYYSAQIFKQLRINPQPGRVATVAEFRAAALQNPKLMELYNAPKNKEANANRESLLTNGAMAAASPILGAMGIKEAAELAKAGIEVSKVVKITSGAAHMIGGFGGMMAGGALSKALDKKDVDPQELIEAIHNGLAEAREKGVDPRTLVTPQLVFMVRVAQDEKFAKQIRDQFGGGKKGFHQMEPAEQDAVMQAFPALANASTSEAYAVATGIMPVEELGATTPNLDGRAAQYALGTQNSSFASRVAASRSGGSFVDGVNARRAAAAAQGTQVS